MITELNVENVLVNGSVVGTCIAFTLWQFKKWMKDREEKEAEIRAELVSTTARIASDLSDRHDKSTIEIKEKI